MLKKYWYIMIQKQKKIGNISKFNTNRGSETTNKSRWAEDTLN